MRKYFFCLAICLFMLITAGCAGLETAGPGETEIVNVVATIYPLADIIGQLGGEKVSASCLLPAGASPHTYEPTVEQARLIAAAQLFVSAGAGLDQWALKLTEAAGPELTVVELADVLDLMETDQYYRLDKTIGQHYNADTSVGEHHADEHHGDEETEHNGHDHGPGDPHFWLDPLLVRDTICPLITETLTSLSPEHASYFQTRLDDYREQLTLLHEEISGAAADFGKRDFIAFHSAWRYFAERYGLREVAVVTAFPGREPSAGWVAALIELIGERQIGAILTEPQFSPALAERIAAESGVKVLAIDPLGGENAAGRESYLELMRFNLDVFKEALE